MAQDLVDPRKAIPRPEWVRGVNEEGEHWARAGMVT